MLRHRYSTAWGVSLGMEMHGSSWNWCTRVCQWCVSHIMLRRYVPTLTRDSQREGAWAQLRPPTPACALEYVSNQDGAGWAIARHSAMPY